MVKRRDIPDQSIRSGDRSVQSTDEQQQTLHELRVHQIELEMQNEELRRIQLELELARTRYFDLYDLAPVGYATINEAGLVLEANLAACDLLRTPRGGLVRKAISKFILKDDQDIYYRHRKVLFSTGDPQQCELRMIRNDKSVFWAHLTAKTQQDEQGQTVCRAVLSDISQFKAIENELRVSEMKYRSLIESSCDVIFCVDEKGVYQFTNSVFAKTFDQTPEYFIGKSFWDIYDQEQADYRFAAVQKVFRTGTSESLEVTVPLKNKTLYFQATISPIKDENNNVVLALTHSIDITSRKLAEFKLRESEERFAKIFHSSPSVITITRVSDGQLLDVNEAFCRASGYTRQEAMASSSIMLNLWADPKDREAVMTRLSRGESVSNKEYSFRKKDGQIIVALFAAQIIHVANEPVILSNILDISDRKRADIELTHSHELMRYIIEHNKSAIAVHDRDLNYLYVSQRYLDDYGIEDKDIIGKHHYDVFPDLPQKWRIVHQKALKGEISSAEEDPYPRADGTTDWTRWECRPWYENDGQIGGIIIYTEVITERKNLEIALANENSLLKTTLASVGDGVISTDHQGHIVLVNRVAEALTGWTQSQAKGKLIQDVFAVVDELSREPCEDIVYAVLCSGKIIEVDSNCILIGKDGTERSIEQNAAPIVQDNGQIIGVVLVFRDVSEKKKKQDEIEYLSYHDHLTGLYNRRHFDDQMKQLDQLKASHLTLIMADVNGLKLTNDAFGHRVGDILLEKVASILKRECRAEDIVSRVGGDEFAILLPETDSEHADKLIARINAAIANEKMDNITLSVSIGYAVKLQDTDDIKDIYRQAEDDMYRRKLSESSSMRSKTIDLIMSTLFAKSNREMAHSKRVSEMSEAIAEKMGFNRKDIEQIRITGLMHDIGKIGVDEAILNSHNKLNHHELKQIQKHPEIGFRILSAVNEFSLVANDVLCHHEKWDGSGYPRGLKGTEISLQARIIGLADAYDAMTSIRTYQKVHSEEEAAQEIMHCAGTQFDPEIARVFVEKVLGKTWGDSA